MTERELLLLKDFKEKIEKLISFNQKIKTEKESLLEEVVRMKEQINLLTIANADLAKKYEDLKFAKSLAIDENGSHEAKIKINRLVREIDRCISLLNKQ